MNIQIQEIAKNVNHLWSQGRPDEIPPSKPSETPPIEPDRIVEPNYPETPPPIPDQPGENPVEYPLPDEPSGPEPRDWFPK